VQGGGMTQVVECLMYKHKILNSNPNTAKRKKKKPMVYNLCICLLSEVEGTLMGLSPLPVGSDTMWK
jgi:hypothetical protein